MKPTDLPRLSFERFQAVLTEIDVQVCTRSEVQPGIDEIRPVVAVSELLWPFAEAFCASHPALTWYEQPLVDFLLERPESSLHQGVLDVFVNDQLDLSAARAHLGVSLSQYHLQEGGTEAWLHLGVPTTWKDPTGVRFRVWNEPVDAEAEVVDAFVRPLVAADVSRLTEAAFA